MTLTPIPVDGLPDLAPVAHSPFTETMCQANHAFYKHSGFEPPWIAYVAVEEAVAVGTCAFKGTPRNNMVEIAYGTHPDHEGKGVATRMVQELVRIARSSDPLVRIIAQTLPEFNASTRVLGKCGFSHVRDGIDDEVGKVWEWELLGSDYPTWPLHPATFAS
jgi:ribosomal-protein-alanine N-acetyltransferase